MGLDRIISDLAGRRGGHVSRRQLLALGLTRHQIDGRVKRGFLITVFTGVYAVGHVPTAPQDRAAGALLACGPHAVLSNHTAAYFWEMEKDWREPIDVTVKGDRHPRGLRIHRSTTITRQDIARHQGLWVTGAARTVLDCAPRLSEKRLKRVINDGRIKHQFTVGELERLLARNPRHPGTKLVLPLIAEDHGPTRSELEDLFKTFVQKHGLPQPEINCTVCGHEVDCFFPVERVIVQVDGWKFHKSRDAYENDRLIDLEILAATGIPTIRTTDRRLKRQSVAEGRRIDQVLVARRPPPGEG